MPCYLPRNGLQKLLPNRLGRHVIILSLISLMLLWIASSEASYHSLPRGPDFTAGHYYLYGNRWAIYVTNIVDTQYYYAWEQCRRTDTHAISQGIPTSGCYLVEPGEPDPATFHPESFTVNQLPIYNVPLVRWMSYWPQVGSVDWVIQRTWLDAKACKEGEKRNPETGECEPDKKCPIPPLPPITDPDALEFEANPDLSDTSRLSPNMSEALQCLENAVSDAGGTGTVGSAYRPPIYNQHLMEVWDKWNRELKYEKRPECQALRSEVKAHYDRHKLVQRPHPNSAHTRGDAFDFTSSLPHSTLDALAEGCHVYRNNPIKDRVHFIYR